MKINDWKIAGGAIRADEFPCVMGILNVTPDSFSDGGKFFDEDAAHQRIAEMVRDGARIIDVGGESTRPGARTVTADDESRRVLPAIKHAFENFSVAISVDTTKREVARRSLEAGAHIINDISGLRFEPELAEEVAAHGAGLVLMHSPGASNSVETLHTSPPVADIMREVTDDLRRGVDEALRRGVSESQIAVDPGIGFGKTQEQNIELLARLDEIVERLVPLPVLVGTSRKRFIGRLLDDAALGERLHGTVATVAVAVLKGASVVRVHDVKPAFDALRVARAIRNAQV